jgi:predicted outer membrane repeat protein
MKKIMKKNFKNLRVWVWATLWLLGAAGAAGAAVFTVNSGADSGSGSLRQAIENANTSAGEDTVNVASSVREIRLTSSLAINGDVRVYGSGATVRGPRTARLFNVSGGAVAFDSFTFTDGYPLSDNGGAFYIDSDAATAVDFVNCTFFGNRAGGSGGAVYVYGSGSRPTTFTNCTLTNNEAAENGGGVAVAGGRVQFDASVATGNRAQNDSDIHVSSLGVVSNMGQYNVVGETNAPESFLANRDNDTSVSSADVFKTPGVLTTVDGPTVHGTQVAELLSATGNAALDKIPEERAVALGFPSVDERGVKRPQMIAADAGAYELSQIGRAHV